MFSGIKVDRMKLALNGSLITTSNCCLTIEIDRQKKANYFNTRNKLTCSSFVQGLSEEGLIKLTKSKEAIYIMKLKVVYDYTSPLIPQQGMLHCRTDQFLRRGYNTACLYLSSTIIVSSLSFRVKSEVSGRTSNLDQASRECCSKTLDYCVNNSQESASTFDCTIISIPASSLISAFVIISTNISISFPISQCVDQLSTQDNQDWFCLVKLD